NEMRGLRFGLSNDRPARDEARAAAAADARHRAEQLARLHDVQLGRVLRIAERDTGGARPEGMTMRMDASVHTPVSVGDLSFRSGIEVIYELKD
ncbi:MAG: SIMPL domain-containing protein, partial [Candidatus Latescibacterota bacterium]|nr:SIMPL domain-containing protein [Candidatus Latescibacterota bacterium]